jgi:hypothetical protein
LGTRLKSLRGDPLPAVATQTVTTINDGLDRRGDVGQRLTRVGDQLLDDELVRVGV